MRDCIVGDLFTVSQRVIDADGFLRAPGVIAKAGNVQEYQAAELGLDGDPTRIIRLYRPRDEVAKSASSFAGKPVTNGHPPGKWVTADNWERYAVGDSDKTCTMQGDDMCTELTFRRKSAIDAVMSGKAGLSNGYKFTFDDSKKTTPEGAAVDGWMTNIQGNHIAIVDRGRGGPGCVIADEERATMGTRSVKIGKRSFEIDAAAADAVDDERDAKEKLAADSEQALTMAKEAEQKAVAAEAANKEHLAKIAALDAEIKQLKEKPAAPDPALVEKLAEERAGVVGDAAMLAPELKPQGKTVDQIRREALTAGSAKDAKIKTIVDAALTGTEIEKASTDVVRSIFAAAVGVAKTNRTANDDSIAADLLRAGSGQAIGKDKDKTANDGTSELVGYEAYCQRLTHRNPKAQA